MDRPKPKATVLTFTTPGGNTLAQAIHRDGGERLRGDWPHLDGKPCTWALMLGPDLQHTDGHLLLPGELRRYLLPLHATTEAEALEAVDRAGCALEAHLDNFATLQEHLVNRVTDAQAYGKTPELPLNEPDDDAGRCDQPGPAAPGMDAYGCTKPVGHDGSHYYAGGTWP